MPDLSATTSLQPKSAHLRVERSSPRDLTEDERTDLAVDLYSVWQTAITARADLNDNLAAWSALYEMMVDELDYPWVGAANLVLPIVPSELDTFKSYLKAQVFVQRLVIVTPGDDDPETARLAPLVEKFYNAELRRTRRDGKTPLEHFETILHLGLRDGGAPCDVLFTERLAPKVIVTEEPKIEGDSVSIGDDGAPQKERVVTRVMEEVREVNVFPRLLKEYYPIPDESTSIQTAMGILTVHWMTEKQMKEIVKEGTFRKEDVEEVLNWVTSGTTDVSRDQLGAYDKTAGGQINVGQGQGALTSKFFKNRGPVQVIRLMSEEFDMDDDEVAEKNIFWSYANQPKFFGYQPYEYIDDNWPTFMWAPFPRPDRPYGYSLIERLADIVADANAGRNQRRNYIDLSLMPILLQREGDTIRDKDRAFFPGAPWIVEDVNNSIKWMTPPPLSPDSFADEGRLDVYIAKLSGQNAPALGAQSAGRRTATESKQQMAAQTVRATDVAMSFRAFLRNIMQTWHRLNQQYLGASMQNLETYVSGSLAGAYGSPQGGTLSLSPEILTRKFNIDIAGLSDPADASSRRTELMSALGVIQKVFPWILEDPEKAYNLAELFFDTFQFAAVERFIGTQEEATARKQAAATAAAGQQAAATIQQNAQQQQPAQQGAQRNGAPQGASA